MLIIADLRRPPRPQQLRFELPAFLLSSNLVLVIRTNLPKKVTSIYSYIPMIAVGRISKSHSET